MRCMLFAILLLVAPRGVVALTWDFDDGITWGWTAWENSYTNVRGSLKPLQSEVVDGVWRIAPVPGRRPTVQLRSPLIGKDSALFDGLTLRLRLIHHRLGGPIPRKEASQGDLLRDAIYLIPLNGKKSP